MKEIDFTDCPRVVGRAYNGANGKKIAVRYDDAVWILKFPPDAHDKPNELSYSNSTLSEHIGSTLYRMLGIEAQETMLGTHRNGRTKVVCACRDFTRPGVRLFDFCSIKNSVLEGESGGTGTELEDVLQAIDMQSFMDPTVVQERFWQMFAVDALLGNFDRHNGNWGFLVNELTGETELAPVFDCGSCLLPQADEKVMQRCLENEDEMNARIYTFPASMLKVNGRKIGYADYLHATDRPDGLERALQQLLPRIKSLDFGALIREVPYLSELQRTFYVAYLERRREVMFGE